MVVLLSVTESHRPRTFGQVVKRSDEIIIKNLCAI